MLRTRLWIGLIAASTAFVGFEETSAQPAVAPPATPATAQQTTQRSTFQRQRAFQRQQTFRRFPQSTTQGFTFQRPYPYHLDYYRQRYNGGYQPYFGNLYGSPAVVGTQPFAFSPYPENNPAPSNQPVNTGGPPVNSVGQPVNAAGQPFAAPHIACPHCQQPVPLPYLAPVASPAAP